MPSKVDALVRNFLQTDGDALYLVPGERMFLMKGQARSVVGREPLSEESFLAVSDELVPSVAPEVLAQEKHRMPVQVDAASEAVEVRFGVAQGKAAIMLARVRRPAVEASPALAEAPAAPVPQAPPPPRAAPARPEGPRSGATAAPAAQKRPPARVPPEPPPPDAPIAFTREDEEPEEIVPLPFEPEGTLSRRRGAAGRKLDDLLPAMVELDASDLHLAADSVPVYRIHGELVPQTDMEVLRSEVIEKLLLPLTPEQARKDFAERKDAAFTCELRGVARFRVGVFRDRRGAGAALRRIPLEVPPAERLGLPAPVVRLGDLSQGLVVVSGPSGNGKTTTLAALVDHVNRTRVARIVTIEDPIELLHENRRSLVTQREVGSHTEGFREAIRAALRSDPDVLVVGDLQDAETIDLALQAAASGHLVLAAMTAASTSAALERLVGERPQERQPRVRAVLAETLRGVVAQALCRSARGGRTAAFEVLLASAAVANAIRDGKTFQVASILQTSRAHGMLPLNDSLLELVTRGDVEPREAYARAFDKTGLLAAFRASGVPLPPGTPDEGDGRPEGTAAGRGPLG